MKLVCVFEKLSTNQRPKVRSWPCRLHESEIRGQGIQRFFSLSPRRFCDSLSPLRGLPLISFAKKKQEKPLGPGYDFFDLFFKLFEEERIIILAFPGLKPTSHVWPIRSEETLRWGICRLRRCDPRKFGIWKIAMKLCTSFETKLGAQVCDFLACFGYFTKWDRSYFEISWDHLKFSL